MIVRHEHVVEGEFGGILRVQTDLLERAATGETFGVLGLEHQDREAARAGLGLGSRDDGDEVRGLAVADEGLLTAQPKAARHPASAGADRLEVRSGAKNGRASCRERGGQYVWIRGVAAPIKK